MSGRRISLNLMGVEDIYDGTFAGLAEAAKVADGLGVHVVTLPDHLGFNREAHATREGFPYPLTRNWYEPLTALAAIAAVTVRVRLTTYVLVAPLRPGLFLAKQLATLDALSGGRVEVGLGIGWQRPEYEAAGVDFADRFEQLEEQVQICRALWAGGPASFHGATASFADFHAYPVPPQGADLPVLLGGKLSRKHAERVVRVGNGWTAPPLPVEEVRASIELLRETAEAAGRDPDDFSVAATVSLVPHGTRARDIGAPHPVEEALQLWDAGVDVVHVLPHAFCDSPDDLPRFLKPLVDACG